jgi:3-oxoacyl-[acyl-carrier protein] reductase
LWRSQHDAKEYAVSDGNLTGRVALVTGGSRGIGRSIGTVFGREGANVAFTYHKSEEEAAETLRFITDLGVEGIAIRADAGDPEQSRLSVEQTVERFGCINILVNNAGSYGQGDIALVDMTVEQWDEMIRTDLRSVFLTTHFTLPHMPPDPRGKIINISSELSKKGRHGRVHYCSAKAGINGFTRALQLELGDRYCVNTLAPGPVATDMIFSEGPELTAKIEREIPARRLGAVEEIAEAALLLASDSGDFFLGQWISPNGGAVFV